MMTKIIVVCRGSVVNLPLVLKCQLHSHYLRLGFPCPFFKVSLEAVEKSSGILYSQQVFSEEISSDWHSTQ